MVDFNLFGIIILIIGIVYESYKLIVKKRKVYKCIFNLLFLMYILLLIKVVFFPVPYQKELIQSYKETVSYGDIQNFIPFKMILSFIRNSSFTFALKQIGGNLILLFPLGIFVSIIAKNKSNKTIFLIGLGTTVFIEITQGLIGFLIGFQYRVVDIDDVILNSLGYVTGMIIVKKLILPILNKYIKK